jgi:hypothetical protein
VPSASHFLFAQKVTQKGIQHPSLRGLLAGQRTTVLTNRCLINYDYNLSLVVQSLQLVD